MKGRDGVNESKRLDELLPVSDGWTAEVLVLLHKGRQILLACLGSSGGDGAESV